MPLALVSGAVAALYLPEKITDMGERRVCGDGDTVQRYVDILSDAGFKAVFGDQKNKDAPVIESCFVSLPGPSKPRQALISTPCCSPSAPVTVFSSQCIP